LVVVALFFTLVLPIHAQDAEEAPPPEDVVVLNEAADLGMEVTPDIPTPIILVVTATPAPTPIVIVVTATFEPATLTPVLTPTPSPTPHPAVPVQEFTEPNIRSIVHTVPSPSGLSLPEPSVRVDVASVLPLAISYDMSQSSAWASIPHDDILHFARDVLRAVRAAYPDFQPLPQYRTAVFELDFWTTHTYTRLPIEFSASAALQYCNLNSAFDWSCFFPQLATHTMIPGDAYEWSLPWSPGGDTWVPIQ
jgi:hypothetical protein